MKPSYKTNATPIIDTLQARIALLVSGKTLRELAADWNCNHVTLWRAMHNHKQCGPKADALRHTLAEWIAKVNASHRKGRAA